jgi:hypothetical protein
MPVLASAILAASNQPSLSSLRSAAIQETIFYTIGCDPQIAIHSEQTEATEDNFQ